MDWAEFLGKEVARRETRQAFLWATFATAFSAALYLASYLLWNRPSMSTTARFAHVGVGACAFVLFFRPLSSKFLTLLQPPQSNSRLAVSHLVIAVRALDIGGVSASARLAAVTEALFSWTAGVALIISALSFPRYLGAVSFALSLVFFLGGLFSLTTSLIPKKWAVGFSCATILGILQTSDSYDEVRRIAPTLIEEIEKKAWLLGIKQERKTFERVGQAARRASGPSFVWLATVTLSVIVLAIAISGQSSGILSMVPGDVAGAAAIALLTAVTGVLVVLFLSLYFDESRVIIEQL